MGEEKISKLAVRLSIPMIISMLSMAIYNLVDTMYISRLSGEALLAVSLSFPVQLILSAIGLGIGIGINSYLAKTLGKKDKEKAKSIIFNGILAGIFGYIIVLIIYKLDILNMFFKIFTTDDTIIKLGIDYLSVIMLFTFFNIFQNIFNKILEAHGKAKLSMIAQFIGIIVNIILDPILIFGINGNLAYGIKGAAIATIVGRGLGTLFSLICILVIKEIELPKIKECKINLKESYCIYKVAIPTMLTESIAPFTTIVLNNILLSFSEDAVSLYGIYYKVQSFIFMIIKGLEYGMLPIVAYNLGANKKDRVKETLRLFFIAALVVSVSGTILFMVIPRNLINIFDVNENIVAIGENAFRILSLGFIASGQCFIITAFFQALGNGKEGLIIFLLRKVVIPFGFIFATKNIIGLNSIWFGFAIADILTYLIALIMYKHKKKQILIEEA